MIKNILFISFVLGFSSIASAEKVKMPLGNKAVGIMYQKAENSEEKLKIIEKYLVKKSITPGYLWSLSHDYEKLNKQNLDQSKRLVSARGIILGRAKYPLLAGLYASQVIQMSKNPEKETKEWNLLHRISQKKPIQNILKQTAKAIDSDLNLNPPGFLSDWNYYRALVAWDKGEYKSANKYFDRISLEGRYYLQASFQQGLMLWDAKRPKDAIAVFSAVLDNEVKNKSKLKGFKKQEVLNYSHLAIARILYENQKFPAALHHYRQVTKDSPRYYQALNEQAWAFFMNGNPNHSLGAIHAIHSPFYKDRFNPESRLLEGIVYYWMCRYEDSRNALAGFVGKHSDTVDAMANYFKTKKLNVNNAYGLFEDIVAQKVQDKKIDLNLLEEITISDSMMLARDELALVMEEVQKLKKSGILGQKKNIEKPLKYLKTLEKVSKRRVGKTFLSELQNLKNDYRRLKSQSEFLYVELLMSEKEQLLGRELHEDIKMSSVSTKKQVKGWGKAAEQSWSGSKKGEYWWDEVGFYIYDLKPQCIK